MCCYSKVYHHYLFNVGIIVHLLNPKGLQVSVKYSEIKNVNKITFITCQLIDASVTYNEINHELSLLEGYRLPLDKCILLF